MHSTVMTQYSYLVQFIRYSVRSNELVGQSKKNQNKKKKHVYFRYTLSHDKTEKTELV